MKLNGLWITALATVALVGQASAMRVDGSFSDWTSYRGTHDSDWSQYWAEYYSVDDDIIFFRDSERDADGGQPYDIEHLFFYYEDNDAAALTGGTLYFGLVTGYSDQDRYYDSGDFFIDLGADGVNDIAVGTDSSDRRRFGTAWVNDAWDGVSDGWDETSERLTYRRPDEAYPYRINDSRRRDDNAEVLGTGDFTGLESDVSWGYGAGRGDRHNFLEIGVDINGLMETLMSGAGISLHWTMECGNDYINAYAPIPPLPPGPNPPVVPLPATALLGGLGMLGVVLRKRRKAR